MKNIYLIFLVAIANFSHNHSQEGMLLVNYELNYGIVKNDEYLLATKTLSKYKNQQKTISNENNVIATEDDSEIAVNSQKSITLDEITTFQQYDTNIIYQIHPQKKVIDSLPNFNWKIESDVTKKLFNFECKKAVCNFRGTKIVAYFTEAIPYPFGPWKFGKLPGLILEVFTEDSPLKYHWKATKINYPYSKTDINVVLDINSFSDALTMKEYMVIRDKEIKEKNTIMNSRLPNSNKTIVKSKTIRLGVEKKFEWEED